jgi:hypothetical protein
MTQITTADFMLGYEDKVMVYFKIEHYSNNQVIIYLCKVLEEELYPRVSTIKEISISHNYEYAQWLIQNEGILIGDEYDSQSKLYHLYKNNHWFISCAHTDGVTKYLRELNHYMKELEE